MHRPTRMCVSCRTRQDRSELLRFGRRPDGQCVAMLGRHVRGRTAYVCPKEPCLGRAFGRGALARSLAKAGRTNVDVDTRESLARAAREQLGLIQSGRRTPVVSTALHAASLQGPSTGRSA